MIKHLRDLEDARNDKEMTALPQPLTCSRNLGASSVAFRNLAESLLLKISRDRFVGINLRIVTQIDCLISNIVQANRHFHSRYFHEIAGQPQDVPLHT